MSPSRHRVWCHTLGCDKNLVDSEALLGHFAARGVAITSGPEDADIWVLNTCGFIAAARADSRDALRALAAAKDAGRRLVVMGCLAQEHAAALAAEFPAADVVAGVGNFASVVDAALAETTPTAPLLGAPALAVYDGFGSRSLLTPPHIAFLKIAEGCDCACSFCRIPRIRGPLRSRAVAEVTDEAAALAARGVRELQLVSQNTSAYGRDIGTDLVTLLTCLDRVPGLRWLRLLYLYPGQLRLDDARRILGLAKIVPYLDLPIQHASPALLRAMRRPADVQGLADFFLSLRAERPDLVLRTTVLLGFPGEREEDVELLADFLARVEFDHLGTYRYSAEAGTAAAELEGRVPDEEVADREARILDIQADISWRRQERRLGQLFPVVVDEVVSGQEAAEMAAALREGRWLPGWNSKRVPVVERAAGPAALARSEHSGYDLDGGVLLDGRGLRAGDWVQARFVAVTPFETLGVAVGGADGDAGKGGGPCGPAGD